ncbi:MAG: PIG-L family deacetylase [Myxococcales bacterium]|nr:PIG-L family deacetylase [Myxococcales bacterium]
MRGMTPMTIVIVFAHPDDSEFFAAGTLAKWARAGHIVQAICSTDGALGTMRRDVTRKELAALRASELARAMETIGARPPILLGFPDGDLRRHGDALFERLVYWLRKLKADRVVTFDPWRQYEIHPDHIEAGRRASEAAVFSCFPLLFPLHLEEGLEPVQPKEVWYMTPSQHRPNRVVDIRETLATKIAALLCHESQVEMLAAWFVPGADPRNLSTAERAKLEGGASDFLRKMAGGVAQADVAKTAQLAEAFYALQVGPGHFDNYQEMFLDMAGAPPKPPEVS